MGAEPGFITASLAGDPRAAGAMPGPMHAQASRPTEPTAGAEELNRLEHLTATVLDHVERLDVRLQRVLAQPTPQPAPATVDPMPNRADGAPGSLLAEQLHAINDRLALASRRLAELGDRVDV